MNFSIKIQLLTSGASVLIGHFRVALILNFKTRPHIIENESVGRTNFHDWFCTETRFDTEARANSKMTCNHSVCNSKKSGLPGTVRIKYLPGRRMGEEKNVLHLTRDIKVGLTLLGEVLLKILNRCVS